MYAFYRNISTFKKIFLKHAFFKSNVFHIELERHFKLYAKSLYWEKAGKRCTNKIFGASTRQML